MVEWGTPDNTFYGSVDWDTTVENTINATVGSGSIRVPAGVTRARITTQVWIDGGFGDAGKTATYEVRLNGVAVASNSVVIPSGVIFVGPTITLPIPQFEINVMEGQFITGFTSCSATPAGYIFIGDDPQWTFIIVDWIA